MQTGGKCDSEKECGRMGKVNIWTETMRKQKSGDAYEDMREND